MTFTTTSGTRGARQPRGRLLTWMNRLVIRRIRRGKDSLGGRNRTLVLHTVGRRSGQERQTPVGWFPTDGDAWLIVASAAGAAQNPAWYHNLAAHPDRVRIEVDGRTVDVRAEQLHGAERAEAGAGITAASAQFATYQTKTDRELPVIRLTPRTV